MLRIKAIDHINMNVKSFDESRKFYSKYFGLKVLKEDISESTGNPYIIMGIPNVVSLCMYERGSFEFKDQVIAHFGLNIENFDETLDMLKGEKLPILYDGLVEWENSRSIYINDPSGHEIELTKNFAGGF